MIASRFNEKITRRLVTGALECITAHGGTASEERVVWVPGAFELPLAADRVLAAGRVDAVVCLGAVIRGETPHFEYVCAECARGIQDVMLRHGKPVAFGVLTTNTVRQATARSGGALGNKGWEAALTAIDMAALVKRVGKKRPARRA